MKTYSTTAEILRDLADGYTIVYNENPNMKTYVAERGLSKAYLFTSPSHWHREEKPIYYYQWFYKYEDGGLVSISSYYSEERSDKLKLKELGWIRDEKSKRTFE